MLAPAGNHLTLQRISGKVHTAINPEPANTLHRPSADVLFNSVARVCGPKACGVIMTGMGTDGASGIKAIKDSGGATLAQNEATSIIFGMPKAAIEKDAIDVVAPLEGLSQGILKTL